MFDIFSKNKTVAKNSGIWGDGQAVLSAVADGVLAIDPSGNIRIINHAAEKIIGWTNGDATGLSFESVFRIVDKTGASLGDGANPISNCLRTFLKFESRDFFLKTQSEKSVPILISINAIDEQKSGIVVVFRDITKEVKENREQTEFISTASHEMRTPVASIEGYLGLALNPATATIDERARSFLEKAHENTKHLGQLFQDLLDISKAEDGRLKNEPVVLDAVEFSRNVWEGLIPKAESKSLRYIFDLDEKKSGEKLLAPVYYIRADRDHLQEVLNNLFENAIKYTQAGQVSVNVSGDKETVKISVSDSGIGIPAEDIPHLFQKFYRVDNSETREIGGTGLGLYLSRKLVESIGGSLDLESEYKKGSTFTVRLPRLTRDQAEKFRAAEPKKEESPTPKIEVPKIEIPEEPLLKPKEENIFAESQAQNSPAPQNFEVAQNPQNFENSHAVPQISQNFPNFEVPQPQNYPKIPNLEAPQPAQISPQNFENSPAVQPPQIPNYQPQNWQNSPQFQQIQPQQIAPPPPPPPIFSQNQNFFPQNSNPYFPQGDGQISQNPAQNFSQPAQAQPRAPTIAEIELMREEFARKMMNERRF